MSPEARHVSVQGAERIMRRLKCLTRVARQHPVHTTKGAIARTAAKRDIHVLQAIFDEMGVGAWHEIQHRAAEATEVPA